MTAEHSVLFERCIGILRAIDSIVDAPPGTACNPGEYGFCIDNMSLHRSGFDNNLYVYIRGNKPDSDELMKVNITIINDTIVDLYVSCTANGMYHRMHNPASMRYSLSGDGRFRLRGADWFNSNRFHRTDGPASERWDDDGTMTSRAFKLNNIPHSLDDQPDVCLFLTKTKKQWITAQKSQWFKNGKEHRDNGPAILIERKGELVRAEWYRNGRLHRIDGPCTAGDKKHIWRIDGRKLDRRKFPYIARKNISLSNLQGIPKMRGPELTKYAVVKALMFNREYGAFLNDVMDSGSMDKKK